MKAIVPSVVVIQERNVRHGENFKLIRVTNRSRREYVAKFMSARKLTFRWKSRQVVIGRKIKELKYKGSPYSIARLLLLDCLGDPFPLFPRPTKIEPSGLVRREADSASSSDTTNPPLSFFNLSDIRAAAKPKRFSRGVSAEPASKLNYPCSMEALPSHSEGLKNKADQQGHTTCSPETLVDFYLLFGSDTNEPEDFDSDGEESETMMVEVSDEMPKSSERNQEKLAEKIHQKSLNDTIKKIEKDVDKIAGSIKSAFEAAAQKVQISYPAQIPSCPVVNPPEPLINVVHTTESNVGQGNLQNFGNVSNNLHIVRNPRPQMGPLECLCIRPCGSVPFFRVPGGCIMVIHATNQTTPVLHGTFLTGHSCQLQYQQVQLPIFGQRQTISIHLGPYRLRREEVDSLFAHVSNDSNYFDKPSHSAQF